MNRLITFLFGPSLQMKRRGHLLVIVDRLGRVVSYSRGVIGGQFAWREIHRPPPAEVQSQEEWRVRIRQADDLCDKWAVKLKEGTL